MKETGPAETHTHTNVDSSTCLLNKSGRLDPVNKANSQACQPSLQKIE